MRQLLLFLGIWLAAGLCVAEDKIAAPEEDAYFLTLQQKGQLIWMGRVQDTAGAWYDIWVCPGYLPPSKYAWKYMKKGGADLKEYVGKIKYMNLINHSGDCFGFAYEECFWGFMVTGIPRAWGKYFHTASERVERRVFGWWFAYPWAFMESVADNTFRLVVGVAGTAVGSVGGVAIVPLYYSLNSAVCSVWHFTVQGVAMPTMGLAWNTVISPPLALIGQQPAESRADGFWMRRISDAELMPERKTSNLTTQTLARIDQWGRLLYIESRPYLQERIDLQEQSQAAISRIQKDIQTAQAEINRIKAESQRKYQESMERQQAHLKQVIRDPEQQNWICQPGANRLYSLHVEQVSNYLLSQKDLPPAAVGTILKLLETYPPSLISTNEPIPVPDADTFGKKTDPARQSIEVIKHSDVLPLPH